MLAKWTVYVPKTLAICGERARIEVYNKSDFLHLQERTFFIRAVKRNIAGKVPFGLYGKA